MISAFIAVISAFIAVRNLRLTVKKFNMDSLKWQRDYFADLNKWADSCVDTLAESVHLCDVDPASLPTFFQTRNSLMSRLSSLTDRGRFFFPNYENDYGTNKPSAFQGYRHEVLDALVEAYRIVQTLSDTQHQGNTVSRPLLFDCQRTFTSRVQNVLDPRTRHAEYQRIVAPQ